MKNLKKDVLRDIVDSVPGMVYQMRFRKDGSRYWSYMSPQGLEMLGLDKSMVGKSDIAERSPKEERESLLNSIEESIKTLRKWEYEFQYIKPDGSKIWLLCTGMPVTDGDEVSMSGVLLDISEKKQTEKLLKESEEKFTKAFSRTPNAVYVTSLPDGVFMEVNEAFCKISGYSKKELIGRSVVEFDFYRSNSDRDKLFEELNKNKKLSNYKIDFRIKSGLFRQCAVFSEIIEIGSNPALVTVVHDQTEQNIALKTLESSETLYRSLFQTATDGILLFKDGLIVDCNNKALEMLGFSEINGLLGKGPKDFSPELQPSGEKSETLASRYMGRALSGTPQSFEWLHIRTDGSQFYSEINISMMELGDEVYLLAFMRDISRRKGVENELIELQEYLQLQIERMPIGLIVWDMELRIKSWNPTAEDIFGYKESEVLGKHPYDLIVPDSQKSETDVIIQRLIDGDETAHSTNENITKGGKTITCFWTNTPFKKFDGTIVGILSMVQDVTDQKNAEADLKKYQDYLEDLVRERTAELEVANTNLDERERSVRLMSEITSASNLSIDPEEAIYYSIERISQHTGWSFGHMVYVDEATGEKKSSGIWYSSEDMKNEDVFTHLKECEFNSPDCPINIAISTRKPHKIDHIKPYGCGLINKLVDVFGLSSSYVFPVEVENEIVGVIQFLYKKMAYPSKRYDEISSQISIQLGMAIQRKRIGDELLLAKDRAEEANKSKSQFLANMSHEIRTPMNSILGFADILSTRLKEGKNQNYLESIRSSGISLLQILNDILDLSKVEAGKLEIEYSVVYLDSFLKDILELFRTKVEGKGLVLKSRFGPKLPKAIMTDKLRLRQIIINLLSNAVKFTERGEISFIVDHLDRKNNKLTLRISIKDTGIGISEKFKRQIFGAFQQEEGDITRNYEGSGLGLAITRNLSIALGGDISVVSEKGEGSTFTVELRDVKVYQADDSEPDGVKITPEMINFKGKRVLLVEDNKDDQQFFSDLMSAVGLEAEIAEDGQDALNILQSFSPDLVLTDIRMPGMDGIELIKRIEADKKLSKVPVVAITASAMKEDIDIIESHSFDTYLLKPVQMTDFYSTLMDYIPFEKVKEVKGGKKEGKAEYVISDEVSAILPGVIDQLESSFMKEWEGLRKKQPIEKVQRFGSDLKTLGIEYNIDLLKLYGESLLASVDSFNVEAIRKEIKNYRNMVKELKSYIR